jgi:hypothetical protein
MSVPSEISELIAGSGNNFHAKVARWFQAHDWTTTISPYYMDESQNKAREIDLICEKSWGIKGIFDKHEGDVVIRLFVECKFVPTYSVFWFSDKDNAEAERLVCASGVFRAENTYTKKHHYLASTPRVAKVFASNAQRASEAEPFYKALNQSLNALVSMRTRPVQLHTGNPNRGACVTLDFPLIVCSSFDRLYGVDFYADSEPRKIADNFQLEVRYAYAASGLSARDEYFLLDVLEFAQLDQFACAMDEDATTAAFLAQR